MNFFIKTFGCQYNEWEAAKLSYILINLGFVESNKEGADIVFLANCSVRKTAVDRALSWTKNLTNQGKKVIILGCILDDDKQKFIDKKALLWDGLDYNHLIQILSLQDSVSRLKILAAEGQKNSNLIPIMKGCNNFCSYCAVPYTRGREISRPFEDILNDVRKVINSGYEEIWLLGQNVNSYEFGFAQLLTEINKIDDDFTIYFTSNHPKDMSDEIIDAIKNGDKIAKTIHLPLQSGSNKILKAMNRPYTKEQYLALVMKIKAKIPNIKITTDTIVGFPGETEEDFQQTVEMFREIKFSQAYNNKYSPRCGTAAFKLGDPIPWSEKQRRWQILNDLVYSKNKL